MLCTFNNLFLIFVALERSCTLILIFGLKLTSGLQFKNVFKTLWSLISSGKITSYQFVVSKPVDSLMTFVLAHCRVVWGVNRAQWEAIWWQKHRNDIGMKHVSYAPSFFNFFKVNLICSKSIWITSVWFLKKYFLERLRSPVFFVTFDIIIS